MGELTAFESKRVERQKIKEKYPKNTIDQRIPEDLPRRNVIDVANRHIKERNVQLLTPFAGNVGVGLITLQNVKAKSFFQ